MPKIPRKKISIPKKKISARCKGHGYERTVAKLFKELGFVNCQTSRFASRMMDDMKVDLVNLDKLYIQCKAVERLGSYHDILDSMPKHKGKYNLVFHKKVRRGTVVAMSQDHFIELLKEMIKFGIISTAK